MTALKDKKTYHSKRSTKFKKW